MSRDHYLLSGAPVPLKPGEAHCCYCAGYGYTPELERGAKPPARAKRCTACMGVGKAGAYA